MTIWVRKSHARRDVISPKSVCWNRISWAWIFLSSVLVFIEMKKKCLKNWNKFQWQHCLQVKTFLFMLIIHFVPIKWVGRGLFVLRFLFKPQVTGFRLNESQWNSYFQRRDLLLMMFLINESGEHIDIWVRQVATFPSVLVLSKMAY